MAYLYDLTDTWNAAGTVFNAIKMNVTNSASAAGSKIVSLQVGSTDRFTVDKDGNGYFSGTLQAVGAISFPNAYLSGNSGTIGMQDNTASILAYNGTGSGGITNTLRFITGSSERMRIDGSGNVGIGTSSPGYRLTAAGASTAGSVTAFAIENPSTNSASEVRQEWRAGGSSWGYITAGYNSNSPFMAFGVSASSAAPTERMRITSSGNVGIGLTSVTGKFQVVSGSSPNAAQLIVGYSGSSENYYDANTHIFRNGAFSEKMRLDSSGNVGIGTSSPQTPLHLLAATATTNAFARLQAASGSAGGYKRTAIQFRDDTGAAGYTIANMGDAGNSLWFSSVSGGSDTNRMALDPNGNLGIGTSYPTTRLDIASTTTTKVRVLMSGQADVQLISDTGAGILGAYSAHPFLFYTNSTERMRITSGGDVGIGTSSPATRLQVSQSNSGDYASVVLLSNSANAAADRTGIYGSPAPGTANAYRGGITFWPGSSGAVSIHTGNNATPSAGEAMRLDSSGNVGIGTSSPGAKLHVEGGNVLARTSAATTSFTATSSQNTAYTSSFTTNWDENILLISAAGRKVLEVGGYTAADSLRLFTANVERARIDSSGNLILGTSGATLAVGRAASPVGSLAGTLEFTGYTTGYGAGIKSYIPSGSPGIDYQDLRFYTAAGPSTPYTERMRIDPLGSVGIGTSSPSATLSVVFNSTVHNGMRVTNNSTTQYAGSGLQMLGPSAAGTQGGAAVYYYNTNAGGTNGALGIAQVDYTGNFQRNLAYYDYSGQYWGFLTNGTERMRVDSSGNLLVGTTSVNGTGWTVNPNGSGQIRSTGTGSEDKIQFANGNGVVGAITTNGTATAYNTSSDYRLKTIDGSIQNSGVYIDALKPVQGSWKADGSRFIGLIAHEVQEVSETQIATGVKDGETMQAMDYSAPELIANLIAEIQSLRARVAQLEGN